MAKKVETKKKTVKKETKKENKKPVKKEVKVEKDKGLLFALVSFKTSFDAV